MQYVANVLRRLLALIVSMQQRQPTNEPRQWRQY
jgi:hypothetical protein